MTGGSTGEHFSIEASSSEIFVHPDQVTGQEPTGESLKIDFGPSCSPQMGLVQELAPKRRTPVKKFRKSPAPGRRASRAKLTGSHSAHTGEQSAENTGTPEDIMEEPSSALATRISRAWDNPSPPPSPSPLSPPVLQDAANNETPATSSGSTTPVVGFLHPIGSDTPLLPPSALSGAHTPTADTTPECDLNLINFDSFSSTLPLLPPVSVVQAPQTEPPADSVDDLLSQTPNAKLDVPRPSIFGSVGTLDTDHINLDQQPILTPSTQEEQEVADELLFAVSELTPPPFAEVPREPSLQQSAPTSAPELVSEPTLPVPVRRSSRRSQTPLRVPTTLTSTLSPNRPALAPLPNSSQSQTSTVTDAPDKNSRKGKERDVSVPFTNMEDGIVDHATRGEATNEEEARQSPPAPDNGLGKKVKRKSKANAPSYTRELGSLSPSSANVLKQLMLPPSRSRSATPDNILELPIPRATTPVPSVAHPSEPPTTPRSTSPTKPIDLVRTPARRIPISEAIAQGTFSPEKNFPPVASKSSVTTGNFGSPIFRRIPLDDPNRSPARRVPISSASLANLSPSKGRAPLRPAFPRSMSEERQSQTNRVQGRSASLEPPSSARASFLGLGKNSLKTGPSGQEGGALRSATLPFPIRPSATTSTPTIPEDDEDSEGLQGPASPSKPSSLVPRQPSGPLGSRIPRIGSKPYARPTPKSAGNKVDVNKAAAVTKAPKRTAVSSAPNVTQRIRTIRKATGKATAIPPESSTGAGPGPATLALRATSLTQASTSLTLKRKREDEPKGPADITKSAVVFRKVISTKNPSTGLALGLTSSPKKATILNAQPPKPQGKIQMRKVIDKRPKDDTATQNGDSTRLALPTVGESNTTPSDPDNPVPDPLRQGEPNPPDPALSTLPTIPERELPPPVVSTTDIESIPPETSPPPPEPVPNPPTGVRRTTRQRKSLQTQSDVPGNSATPAPPRTRRRATGASLETDLFGGLTALALKSLTTSNTTRNQRQTVELTTEVVRIDGARPDSPTTKVRTTLERQKEMRIKQRQERAERRRRIAEGLLDDDVDEVDGVSESEDVSVLLIERDEDGVPLRHAKGPGEDEEYTSPLRPDRPPKRGRFEDDVEVQNEKRVKWDRGLATTVYFDTSSPKPKRSSQEAAITKGCLTPAAKTIRLDNMGNVLDANVPLLDLVHESIAVKKFVYDDDIAAPPLPTARTTRSKAKKPKS